MLYNLYVKTFIIQNSWKSSSRVWPLCCNFVLCHLSDIIMKLSLVCYLLYISLTELLRVDLPKGEKRYDNESMKYITITFDVYTDSTRTLMIIVT